MTRSLSAWQDTMKETPARPDPLTAMLSAAFGNGSATIPLDNALEIVAVLRERCSLEVLHEVYHALEIVLASFETKVQ